MKLFIAREKCVNFLYFLNSLVLVWRPSWIFSKRSSKHFVDQKLQEIEIKNGRTLQIVAPVTCAIWRSGESFEDELRHLVITNFSNGSILWAIMQGL